MAIPNTIITRNVDEVAGKASNIYESIMIVAKRAKQIAVREKDELNSKLADFASSVDNLEEIFENREQIEISKFYERQPKAALKAMEEYMENKIMWRRIENE